MTIRISSSRKSQAIYEKTTTGFTAYVPELPGRIATGETLDSVKTATREAIEFHVDGMREEGTPIPFRATIAAEEIAVRRTRRVR